MEYIEKPNSSTCAVKAEQLKLAERAGFHFHKNEENGIRYTNPLKYSEHCFHRFIDIVKSDSANQMDAAYRERNTLVALLASMFPSGIKRTPIDGWDPAWTNCCYIDFPWGQASWHYHNDDASLFAHLPEYQGEWDGHTTDEKYEKICTNMCTLVTK